MNHLKLLKAFSVKNNLIYKKYIFYEGIDQISEA